MGNGNKAGQRRALREAAAAQLPRLVRGANSWALLKFLIVDCDGRSPSMTARELAFACGMKLHSIQHQLLVLHERGIIEIAYTKPHGKPKLCVVSLPYAKWAELEDFEVWRRKRQFLGGWANTTTGAPLS